MQPKYKTIRQPPLWRAGWKWQTRRGADEGAAMMMKPQADKLTRKAYAKINLGLDVVGRLENGYHQVRMIMQTVGIYDRLTFAAGESGIRIVTDSGELPTGPDNLIYRAAVLLLETCGVEAAPGENEWSQYGWQTLCDIEQLEAELKKIFKNKVIPGQPSTKTGKPYKEIFYNQLLVNVDDMNNVVALQKALNDMGYDAYSQAEWVESQQRTMGYIQAVLGGIGAVSLFVAAIGITNTMMMSIYERTKEIGVMKVLGCDLRNIRSLFLMEAGFIGFIGGVIGLILSIILSVAVNKVAAGVNDYMGTTGGISYIPVWLGALSLVFAVMVGMVAGFFPARRAMRLSPLAAIRNE